MAIADDEFWELPFRVLVPALVARGAALIAVSSLVVAADVQRLAAESSFVRYSLGAGDAWFIRTADRWWVGAVTVGLAAIVLALLLGKRAGLAASLGSAAMGASIAIALGLFTEALFGIHFEFRPQLTWWAIGTLPFVLIWFRSLARQRLSVADRVTNDDELIWEFMKKAFFACVAIVAVVASLGERVPHADATAPPAAVLESDTATQEQPEPTPPIAPFDPAAGQWGDWPTQLKPAIAAFSEGDAVLYLQGVLVHRAARPEVVISGGFDGPTHEAVVALQTFFGLPGTGLVDAATWDAIDLLATSPSDPGTPAPPLIEAPSSGLAASELDEAGISDFYREVIAASKRSDTDWLINHLHPSHFEIWTREECLEGFFDWGPETWGTTEVVQATRRPDITSLDMGNSRTVSFDNAFKVQLRGGDGSPVELTASADPGGPYFFVNCDRD